MSTISSSILRPIFTTNFCKAIPQVLQPPTSALVSRRGSFTIPQWPVGISTSRLGISFSKVDLVPDAPLLDSEGVLYWELLDSETTVTASVYATQLQSLADAMRQKRPERGMSACCTITSCCKSESRENPGGWEVLLHPPYSTDLVAPDYRLLRALKQHL
ncbi:unnamed protein product [Heligmosomoides polygyrus]|uniref:Histone-lysine N-methyltransferase SETMAR n=1 Tax=Heligmosomoides polygyrus TaxID=6339 RepID=A0A183FR71_HELPZ|nr:unnamed protein product [Heligmosomoides polygyrus]